MSKINVQMTQPKYIIKPEDGVVICSITARGNNDCYTNFYDVFIDNSKLKDKYGINYIDSAKVFTAVTKLHKGDKWDEVKGKRNIYKFYLRLYRAVYNEIINKDIKLLNQHIDNLFYCANREGKHLKELMQ